MNAYPRLAVLIAAGLLTLCASAPALATEPAESPQEPSNQLFLGYRAVSTDRAPARAAEYQLLQSGPVAELTLQTPQNDHQIFLDARIQDEQEHHIAFDWDYKSLLRIGLRSEGLVHNLDHIPYLSSLPEARPPASVGDNLRFEYLDQDPNQTYRLDLHIQEANLRAKLGAFPAHANVSYWRLEREGNQQLRFVDENCAGACHMVSRTRQVDRVTEEVKGGLDAHLGWFDIAFEQLYREFRERADPPMDNFDFHGVGGFPPTRPAGTYIHDSVPNSRLTQSTIRANTSFAGGLNGATSFSIGQRENRSDPTGVQPILAETDFYKATGDVTYTPGERLTISLRYRLLDLDSENSDQLFSDGLHPDRQPLAVRESMDIRRAFHAASINYRPIRALTLRADVSREVIKRSNTGAPLPHSTNHSSDPVVPASINPFWELPEEEVIDRIRLSASTRLLARSALKVNGWAEYRTSDDPAYGASFKEGGEIFLGAVYAPGMRWGITTNLRALEERNDEHHLTQFASNQPVTFDLDRKREQQNLTAGFWINPLERVTFNSHYGFLRTRIIQDLLFGTPPNPANPGGPTDYTIRADDTKYTQDVHTVAANISWQLLERLGLQLEGYHIRSKADFSPDFFRSEILYNPGVDEFTATADSADLREISQIDIRQNGVRSRLNWQIDTRLAARFEFTYDDYEDRNGDAFDGSVQTYLAGLNWTW